MAYPELNIYNINDVPIRIVDGPGEYRIQLMLGSVVYGPSTIDYSVSDSNFGLISAPLIFRFTAPAELYAVCGTGLTGKVRVLKYF